MALLDWNKGQLMRHDDEWLRISIDDMDQGDDAINDVIYRTVQ